MPPDSARTVCRSNQYLKQLVDQHLKETGTFGVGKRGFLTSFLPALSNYLPALTFLVPLWIKQDKVNNYPLKTYFFKKQTQVSYT